MRKLEKRQFGFLYLSRKNEKKNSKNLEYNIYVFSWHFEQYEASLDNTLVLKYIYITTRYIKKILVHRTINCFPDVRKFITNETKVPDNISRHNDNLSWAKINEFVCEL